MNGFSKKAFCSIPRHLAVRGLVYVKATHRSSTSAAQHKTQANVRQTDERWKKRDEGEEDSSLFAFSQIPSLLLVVNTISTLSIFVDQ